MKDEIKEILEDVKRHLDYVEATKQASIRDNEMKAMYDYITNLEQENQIDKYKILKKLQEENGDLKEKIENLTTMTVCGDRKQIKNTAQYKLDIYKSRNEKAISKIKLLGKYDGEYCTRNFKMMSADFNDLLNILQGDDKE